MDQELRRDDGVRILYPARYGRRPRGESLQVLDGVVGGKVEELTDDVQAFMVG